jgi:glycosyltransferase involved in cell wall biosynthesis
MVVGGFQENSAPGRAECSHDNIAESAQQVNNRENCPRISIITPCLNGAMYIGEAIESVLRQRYPHLQHIVVDGGSTDGTLQILERYPHLKIVAGPDRGMYDALNKALAVADGEIIGILNSDDCYSENVFSSVSECMTDQNIAALAGEAISFSGPAGMPQEAGRFSGVGKDLLYEATLGNPCINAWFFRASVFPLIGRFDANYKVAGDREFMLRLACGGLRCAQLSLLVYRYRVHPDSMTFGGSRKIWQTIAREHDKMTGEYLRKQGLPKYARSLIRQARTRDTLRIALRCARQHDWRGVMLYAVSGTRHDPAWPLRFIKRVFAACKAS